MTAYQKARRDHLKRAIRIFTSNGVSRRTRHMYYRGMLAGFGDGWFSAENHIPNRFGMV